MIHVSDTTRSRLFRILGGYLKENVLLLRKKAQKGFLFSLEFPRCGHIVYSLQKICKTILLLVNAIKNILKSCVSSTKEGINHQVYGQCLADLLFVKLAPNNGLKTSSLTPANKRRRSFFFTSYLLKVAGIA